AVSSLRISTNVITTYNGLPLKWHIARCDIESGPDGKHLLFILFAELKKLIVANYISFKFKIASHPVSVKLVLKIQKHAVRGILNMVPGIVTDNITDVVQAVNSHGILSRHTRESKSGG